MAATPTIVFENGTMLGAMSEQRKQQPPPLPNSTFVIPEIVISASQSSNSLHRSRHDIEAAHPNGNEEISAECTALLEQQQQQQQQQNQQQQHRQQCGLSAEEDNEFEQFILNRTTSESNMLESSIYSELQFTSTAAGAAAPPSAAALNTSACSRSDSRQSKRTRRKTHTKGSSKGKCNNNNNNNPVAVAGAGATVAANGAPPVGSYPPQYTAIFLDHHHHHHNAAAAAAAAAAANAMANAAATSPFLNANPELQYHQYYQQRPMGLTHPHGHHHLRRTLLDVAVPLAGGSGDVGSSLAGTNLNMSAMAGGGAADSVELGGAPLGYSFRKWFARPSLPFVIGIFALGGVACTLGGIVLGSTGLIEHSTQYLSAALLMIGIGVSLLVISGAIWRLSLPDDVDDCPCFRRMETCRNCNSPHCTNRLLPGSYLYPEFQHRPPPPSYLTSLNEYAFVYHPSAHPQAAYAAVRMNTPPPLYRSTYSLNTSASHMLSAGMSLPPTSEQVLEEPVTREAISQTSFKELEIVELHEDQSAMPLTREAESQTLFKEVELD
ncbi:PREDICTED: uncharacterized protein LOC108616249 [Drosophila arizonae]|uniref:Uncharacterized protein LOC108616249 n=1 Tax=Drosophila arizonae TaxID=7263 RepID=A0ABM1PHY1_DROAR|nr:PREDICTED: uncharacterized protein LOC108616249 [Drosophila arizonae]